MKIAYFDCQFGAAGDMLLGALLDAGLDQQHWLEEVKKLALPKNSYAIEINRVQRRTLAANKVEVIVNPEYQSEHQHEHHDQATHSGHGPERQMSDVQKIIDSSPIDQAAKTLARKIIRRLANCEGPVHGMDPDAVYFHEVGAIDTIIDIVGFSIGYHLLGIDKSFVSRVPIGKGHVLTASGYFPLPAPAVAYMLADIKAPTIDFDIDYECLTPTAVAILAEIASGWNKPPQFDQIFSVGSGAGTKDPSGWPNICRVILGSQSEVVAELAPAL